MKYILLTLFFLSSSLQSEIFLECKPTNKKNKEEINHDLLVVMVEDGVSSYFNKKVEDGVYLYDDERDEFFDSGTIYSEYFLYRTNNIRKVTPKMRRNTVTVSRKNLEGTALIYGIKVKEKLVTKCEMRNIDEFSELVYSQMANRKSGNIF